MTMEVGDDPEKGTGKGREREETCSKSDRLEKRFLLVNTNDQRCRVVKVRGRESFFSFGQVPLNCLLQGTIPKLGNTLCFSPTTKKIG